MIGIVKTGPWCKKCIMWIKGTKRCTYIRSRSCYDDQGYDKMCLYYKEKEE